MKLEDVKHLIDAYFDAVTPEDVIADFEELGYEFEEIPNDEYPKALEIEEENALQELHFQSPEIYSNNFDNNYRINEMPFSEMRTVSETTKFEYSLNNYSEESYYNNAA